MLNGTAEADLSFWRQ